MPRYDFTCLRCNITKERYVPLDELDIIQTCENCTAILKREFPKQGTTLGDERTWLSSTTEMLKGSEYVGKDPVSSMTEYRKLLKEKGLTPIG